MSGITILNTYLLLFTCDDKQWIIPHTIFDNENKEYVAGICFDVFQAWAWLISQTIDVVKRWWNLWEHNKINNRVKEIWDVERKMSESVAGMRWFADRSMNNFTLHSRCRMKQLWSWTAFMSHQQLSRLLKLAEDVPVRLNRCLYWRCSQPSVHETTQLTLIVWD